MNVFFFGSSERRLFGAFHPAAGGTVRDTAVLLCGPLGQEYMRTHRALRQLATRLANAGYGVLRFDYYGSGDSAGNPEEISLDGIAADIATAVEELRDTAAVANVDIVGLRLGASVAAEKADGVGRLVLWDPIVSGAAYERELLRAAQADAQGPFDADADPIGVTGFPLTRKLRDELRQLDLCKTAPAQCQRIDIVTSAENDGYHQLKTHLETQSLPNSSQVIHSAGDWDDLDRFGAALLPQEIIRGIVELFSAPKSEAVS